MTLREVLEMLYLVQTVQIQRFLFGEMLPAMTVDKVKTCYNELLDQKVFKVSTFSTYHDTIVIIMAR